MQLVAYSLEPRKSPKYLIPVVTLWYDTEKSEEQYFMMALLYWVDLDSTQWVWNVEYNIENFSETIQKQFQENHI